MAITQIKSTGIANGAITTQQLAPGVGAGPTITQIQITDSSYNVIDDTAVSTSGGYIKITGSGFSAGAIVVVGNINASSTTFVSSTVLNVQVPSAVAGTYTVYVVNTNGSTAIGVNGLTYSGTPNWVTGSTLPSGLSGSPISIQLSATGDAPFTYALAAGNTLPTGLTLTSSGLLSGTVTVANETVYAFTIIAIDAEAQDSPRAFTITITNADPYFYLTTLLLPGNGTNNGNNNTFLDSSTNAFTITKNGNTAQGTFSPFSQTGWSNYFDGNGDTLTITDNAALEIGSGDFTFEAWIYFTAYSGTYGGSFYNSGICGKDNESTRSYTFGVIAPNTSSYTALSVGLFTGATFVGTQANYNFQLNRWYHVAGARQSGTIRLFVDGILIGSGTNTTSTNNGSQPFCIGAGSLYTGFEYFFPGYISNFRFVNGTAVYTSNFTPPTSPLTAIANTSVLTCQNNRFIDNSTNNFAITKNGNTSVQSFSPFAPTSSYTTSTVGGSAYFDGTGDNLVITNPGSPMDFGTGDFTIDFWVYSTVAGAQRTIITSNNASWETGSAVISGTGSGDGLRMRMGVNGTISIADPNNFELNTWNYYMFTRSGTNFNLYKNGTRVATGSGSGTVNFGNNNGTKIGGGNWDGASSYITGYISDLRTIKGTALFTGSTCDVPTTPSTAITNTSLLLNFTNGQITDATSKNLLETVGDAKISTTQSKWGGSSIYFDGTGDYLVTPSNTINTFVGDFTVEMWVYRSAGNNFFFTLGDSVGSTGFDVYIGNSASNLRLYSGNSVVIDSVLSSINFPVSTWTHLALVRSSGSVKMYVAGTQVGSAWSSSAIFSGKVYVGAEFYNGSITGTCNGYMNDVRVTNGIARYTANFTPPTSAFATL